METCQGMAWSIWEISALCYQCILCFRSFSRQMPTQWVAE